MAREDLKRRLEALAAQALGRPSLVLDEATQASDIGGWDSLNHVKLLVAVEQAFCIRFDNDDLEDPRNWGEFVTMVERKIGTRPSL